MARKADPTIRGRLLNAAKVEFSAHGLDGARISTITENAGVSKGAFYLHFETKEHAFEEVAAAFFETAFRMMDGLEEILETKTDIEEMRRLVLDHDMKVFEYLWCERAFARVLFQGAHSAKHHHLIEAFARRVETRVEGLLEIDLRQGRVRPGINVKILAGFVAGGFDRYARFLLSSEEKPDIRTDLQGLSDFMHLGLLHPELALRLLNEEAARAPVEPPASESRPVVAHADDASSALEASLSPELRTGARES